MAIEMRRTEMTRDFAVWDATKSCQCSSNCLALWVLEVLPFLAMTARRDVGGRFSSAQVAAKKEDSESIKFRDGLELTSDAELPTFSRVQYGIGPWSRRLSRVLKFAREALPRLSFD